MTSNDEPAKQEGSYLLRATMGGDVRVDIYDKSEQPIMYFIIPREEAHLVASEIVSLAGAYQ